VADGSVKLRGYRELLNALASTDRATGRIVRAHLRAAADPIRAAAEARFESTSPRTAAGYRVVVRARGIAVEQRLRKTTGLHPEYGALQMRRALLPALEDNRDIVERELEGALDDLVNVFDRG
jgi:hypothetical protein